MAPMPASPPDPLCDPLHDRLLRRLRRLPEPLRQACRSGDCDAFALALHAWLKAQGIPAVMAVGRRQEYDHDGQMVQENPLSHVVVQALETYWDVRGPDAIHAWEHQWTVPTTTLPSGHRFTWSTIDEPALRALRRQRDDREVRDDRLRKCTEHLGRPLSALLRSPPPEPSHEPSPPAPRRPVTL